MRYSEKKIPGLLSTVFAVILIFACPKSWGNPPSAQLKSQGDTLSFELSGQNDWNYELKRVKSEGATKIILMVKGIGERQLTDLKNVQNPFVKSVKVAPVPVDGKKQIEFTLNNDRVETFDYLTDFPSKLIVDFYVDEKPVVADEAGEADRKRRLVANSRVGLKYTQDPTALADVRGPSTKSSHDKKKTRAPAGIEYFSMTDPSKPGNESKIDLKTDLFNVDDDKFARFRLKSYEINQVGDQKAENDYYIAYPLLEQEFTFWTKMKSNFPNYEIQSKNSDENKQIRLIKKLYDNKRTLVLRQTVEWFEKKYPQSTYLDVAFAMVADRQMTVWNEEKKSPDFDLAQFYYGKILAHHPGSALAERTSLATGLYELEKKNYLSALRKLKNHSENPRYATSESKKYAELGMAQSLAKLTKYDEAVAIAEAVEASDALALTKAEAAYAKASFLMAAEKYSEAKTLYDSAMSKYPQFATQFPNAIFNKMEALFRLRMNVEAHATAIDFVQNFPYHEFAPYALTRIGELLEVIGASQEKAVGAFLEVHFRYGDDPKTIVARLHLLSTRMKGMKEVDLIKTIEKMDELTAKSTLEGIGQFKATMVADGYAKRKEFKKAIDTLVKHYRESPQKKNSEQVTNRIRKNIGDHIQYLASNQKFRDVLRVHKEYADNWLRKQQRFDTYYYLGEAYRSAGAYEPAIKNYDLAEMHIQPRTGRDAVSLPKLEQIHLAKSEAQFEHDDFAAAEKSLNLIKKPDALSATEQIARVNLASRIYEKKGDNESAERFLGEIVRVWRAQPNLVSESAVRLAKLWSKTERSAEAVAMLDGLLAEKLQPKNIDFIQKAKSQIAIDANMPDAAIRSLTYLVNDKPDAKSARAEDRYQLGELYFQKGDLKKARDVWTNFAANDDALWSQLAQEKMKSAQWQDQYKKYLKRIPAAVGVE